MEISNHFLEVKIQLWEGTPTLHSLHAPKECIKPYKMVESGWCHVYIVCTV